MRPPVWLSRAAAAMLRATASHCPVPGGLANGTVLMSDAENGWSVDAAAHGDDELGSRMSVFINGVEEEHHTSCSTPYVINMPAPLDDPKGDPSPNWFVLSFEQRPN